MKRSGHGKNINHLSPYAVFSDCLEFVFGEVIVWRCFNKKKTLLECLAALNVLEKITVVFKLFNTITHNPNSLIKLESCSA
jgi:hypothetical protein